MRLFSLPAALPPSPPPLPLRYSIDWKSDLDSYFDIDPVEGTISTNELLDRESVAQHNISVVATKLSECRPLTPSQDLPRFLTQVNT